jgi:two-component system, NtrC family, sensor kinase
LKSDKEIQKMIREALRPLVFNNGRGYFFIYDMQGNNVLLPFSPHLEGKNLWNFQDSKGEYNLRKTVKMIREQGEGFQRWHWWKPGETELMSEKIGYHKHFEPYDWWIGTGEYLEDFERDIQQESLEWINKIRFGQDGYIFAYNFNGTILAHFLQERIGHNILQDTTDPYGIKIVGELIRISQQEGGGFLDYEGKIRPSTGLRAQKIGHSQSVKDWQWTVGAGIYVDAINDVIAVERKHLIKKIVRDILIIFIIFVFSLVFIGVILRYISQKTTDHLTVFTRFFEQASTKSVKIGENAVHYSEFKLLARSANQMMDDRKRAEEEATKLRLYLSNIIDSMPSILIGVDKEGNITQWNSEASRVTGISADAASGQLVTQAFPRLAKATKELKHSIATRQILRDHRKSWKEEGETHYENVTIYPLITNGIDGAVIRVDDVTEQVRLEEMMIQSEKMLSVGGLAAGMAHEINNPLAGMVQTAEVMAGRLGANFQIPANRRAAEAAGTTLEAIESFMTARGIPRMIDTINASGKRMAAIVDNMLSFARQGDAAISSHNLEELIDKTLEIAATDYDLKKRYDFKLIMITKQYDGDLPRVPCQDAKIQQVLLNIFSNGAQAMQEAGTQNPRFIVRTGFDNIRQMVCIEIEDNGPGMDEKTRKRVFEPFFTTKPVGVGTGLGMSVSYFIITENHGGEMVVGSRPGAGTKFIIRLPIQGK